LTSESSRSSSIGSAQYTFLAIALGGYFTVLSAKFERPDEKGEALLTISCLGFVFSVARYFVNRASKFWQENRENHADLLEDAVIGPLYKTVVHNANLRFWQICGTYPFSVPKINQLLSLFVMVLFFSPGGGYARPSLRHAVGSSYFASRDSRCDESEAGKGGAADDTDRSLTPDPEIEYEHIAQAPPPPAGRHRDRLPKFNGASAN
jgi:hypothetical protein